MDFATVNYVHIYEAATLNCAPLYVLYWLLWEGLRFHVCVFLNIFFSLVSDTSSGESVESPDTGSAAVIPEATPSVIPSQGDLLGDLLNLDLTPPTSTGPVPPTSGLQLGPLDLLGGGLDSLVSPDSKTVSVFICNEGTVCRTQG